MIKKRPLSDGESPEKGVVTLCGDKGCCPEIDFTSYGKVILRDEFGGRVKLTTEQWEDLKARFATVQKPTRRK